MWIAADILDKRENKIRGLAVADGSRKMSYLFKTFDLKIDILHADIKIDSFKNVGITCVTINHSNKI